MNWRKHLNEFKVGDVVKIIKPCSLCYFAMSADNCKDDHVGEVGTIESISEEDEGYTGYLLNGCPFSIDQLQKV